MIETLTLEEIKSLREGDYIRTFPEEDNPIYQKIKKVNKIGIFVSEPFYKNNKSIGGTLYPFEDFKKWGFPEWEIIRKSSKEAIGIEPVKLTIKKKNLVEVI